MKELLVIFLTAISTSARITPYRTTVITPDELQPRYDFVIVGGGSAGSLLASRLSEIPDWKILLIEAGDDETFLSDIPLFGIFLQKTRYNWKYSNLPEKSTCLAYNNNQCNAPRGKVLGGTGVLNDMLYSRCHKKDYDEWASMGNPGWSYEDVLPYFKKSEKMKIPEYLNSSFHSTRGELNVERLPFTTELAKTFLKASEELGYDIIDYNNGENVGFSLVQVNMINGTRCSGNRAFLSKASVRENLHVLISAQAARVLIDDYKKVWGVEFIHENQIRRVLVSKEVILSAGVFNSPKLLMLSGIGPRNQLKRFNIPIIQNLPVGKTIRDHYGFIGTMFSMNSSIGVTMEKHSNIKLMLKNLEHSKYLSFPGTEAIGFIRTKYAEDERPDVELVLIPAATTIELSALRTLGMKEDYVQKYYETVTNNTNIWSLSAYLLRPKSEGRLRLKSRNPFDDPIIEGDFFKVKQDMKVLIEGIKEGIKLSDTKAFARYDSKIIDKNVPGCEAYLFQTDDYWECAIRYLTIEIHHQTGTCQMGPKNDKNAVVDHELKVHGITGLRIADTSVIPLQLSGHTNAPAYMIAEKAADMIKNEWSSKMTDRSRI